MIIARASGVIHALPLFTRANSLTVSALLSATLADPLDEFFHLRAIFPGQLEKFARVQWRSFRAEESFKSPAKVWTVPRIQAISASDDPIVAKSLKHSVC